MSPEILSEPAVRSYILYSTVLAIKLLGMVVLTSKQRYRKNVFANEEDAKFKKGVVKLNDPDVERVRRAHLNDLENIPVFWILGALYLTTSPEVGLAVTLFRVFTVGRVAHTLVYAVHPLPQPARAIAFAVPTAIMWYMAAQVILHFVTAL